MGRVREFIILLAQTSSAQAAESALVDPNLTHITGHLKVTLAEAVSVHYVKITLIGESDARWTTGSGDNRRTHHSHHVLFEQVAQMLPNAYAGSENIPEGTHMYPFSFQFDARWMPSSFQGNIGYIKYRLKAAMDRKGIIFDDKAELELNIENRPVVEIPTLMNQVYVQDEDHFGCLCCKSGPIIGRVTLERSGFAPGDTVSVSVSADNLSNEEITPKLKIVQTVRYSAGSSSRHNTKYVSEEVMSSLRLMPNTRNASFTMATTIFTADVCSNIPWCEMHPQMVIVPNISINYFAKVSIGALKVMVPIFIGQHAQQQDQQLQYQPYVEPPSYNSIYYYGDQPQ